ncbi:MAG: DNA recombination/repair protein RecA, partial [Bacteroidales bacterium]|nr:DNA recombination/repair protein RecA [Bacteroidales bacterium]
DIRRISQIKEGDNVVGNRVKVKIVKNKVAPPFKTVEFDLIYGQGVSRSGEIIDMATDMNIIKKSGSWFSYGDTKLGQGRDAVKQLLQDNPELSEELEQAIRSALKEKEA